MPVTKLAQYQALTTGPRNICLAPLASGDLYFILDSTDKATLQIQGH